MTTSWGWMLSSLIMTMVNTTTESLLDRDFLRRQLVLPLTDWEGKHKLTFRAGSSARTSFLQSPYCPKSGTHETESKGCISRTPREQRYIKKTAWWRQMRDRNIKKLSSQHWRISTSGGSPVTSHNTPSTRHAQMKNIPHKFEKIFHSADKYPSQKLSKPHLLQVLSRQQHTTTSVERI